MSKKKHCYYLSNDSRISPRSRFDALLSCLPLFDIRRFNEWFDEFTTGVFDRLEIRRLGDFRRRSIGDRFSFLLKSLLSLLSVVRKL